MNILLYVIFKIAYFLVWGLQIAMIARMIVSWIPGAQDSKINDFIYAVTEPMIIPIRRIFERKGWFRRSPLDMPFMVTYFILMIVMLLLGMI